MPWEYLISLMMRMRRNKNFFSQNILYLMTKCKQFFDQREIKKMSSIIPFSFNAAELCVVIISEKPWTRNREVCRALEENTKTAHVIKAHVSPENYTQQYQMSSVSAAVTPINWPKDSQKYDIYTNEEGIYELLFSSQQPKQKTLEDTAAMSCFLMFGNSLQTK